MKSLSILGATGSIGASALDIVRLHPDRFRICALTAARNIDAIAGLVEEFNPDLVSVLDANGAGALLKKLPASCRTEVLYGEEGFCAAAEYEKADMVLLSMVGAAGLKPALSAIRAGKQIALANKETLVMAGEIVMQLAAENKVSIRPVDSEHSAIYQCLNAGRQQDLKTIFLTASGGPFRTTPKKKFVDITLEDALKHPTWNMGSKITIDSATLMNKALEIVEAVHLFDVPPEKIKVLVHPQSIVHSMVGFEDGSVVAHLGQPDMKGAISYALSEPERLDLQMPFPDFAGLGALNFEEPDTVRFPSLLYAFEACRQKGTLPAVMNAANEAAVALFLSGKIGFPSIFSLVAAAMERHRRIDNPDLLRIIEADQWARDFVQTMI